MGIIDTHTHLYLPEFANDRKEVIQTAINMGIEKMLLPNIDSESIAGMIELCRDYPGVCYPMIGLHPGSVKENFEEEMRCIQETAKKEKFIAIGEIGIDLYWDKTFFKEQVIVFRQQIELAIDLNLPVVIHARNSFDEIFDVLREFQNSNLLGVFHSFTGGVKELEQILKFDFYLGINGIVTFKNSGLDRIVAEIPQNRILIETDSPYLSPVPKRGKRNESSHAFYINAFLAGIFRMNPDEFAAITRKNAVELFKLE